MNILDYIAIPLGYVMKWCNGIIGNYGLAIILFTLLSKIIVLPLTVWVHKNSIKLVKLQPDINRIKIKYFGDAETIGEEQSRLYKKEKYNPFASMIPLFVQILILLGLIAVIKNDLALGGIDTNFCGLSIDKIPSEVGGIYYISPIIAGLSSLLFCMVQNRSNVLQAEQSFTGKFVTSAISIGISLFLGFEVTVGVAMYWIFSNIFSIFQQYILNAAIPPSKYIDFEAIEATKAELASINKLGVMTPEQKKREKADYKRFFGIVNKHIVFYSESNGFYKYFEGVIGELLRRTNVSIHYITSDPDDKIFELAKTEPKIKPYYIGEKKLITLFMKMDADIVVMTMPDIGNYHYKRSYLNRDTEYVYMFHYPLSTHMVLHTGALDHYDTIFCVGDFQFDEIRKTEEIYGLPQKKLISCGYGQLESLKAAFDKMPKTDRARPKVLIAPSWQVDNILDSCIDGLLGELLGKGFDVVVRPHPEYMKRYRSRMEEIVKRYENYDGGDLSFELDFTSNSSIFDSDAVITDWSGTAYEFSFVTLRPAVFVDTTPKVNNPEYVKLGIEPLELTLRDEMGVRVSPDNMDGLSERLSALIADGDAFSEKIHALRDKYIANFGTSSKAAYDYLISSMKEHSEKRKKENK